MHESTVDWLKDFPSFDIKCPSCSNSFPVRFGKFGHSPYSLVGCDTCPTLLALPEIDPVLLYLEHKYAGNEQELSAAISRSLIPCTCEGSFRVFDGRRRCPQCRAEIQEETIFSQCPEMKPPMRPILSKLLSPENDGWKNLGFLREEIETAAREYEADPATGKTKGTHWLAKEIYDMHIRKITPEILRSLLPSRRDLFIFNRRVYHDHGGARGPWWRFWSRDILYPEKCGAVFDIDQKQLKCSTCAEVFDTRLS